jgi:hypothetical protein
MIKFPTLRQHKIELKPRLASRPDGKFEGTPEIDQESIGSLEWSITGGTHEGRALVGVVSAHGDI